MINRHSLSPSVEALHRHELLAAGAMLGLGRSRVTEIMDVLDSRRFDLLAAEPRARVLRSILGEARHQALADPCSHDDTLDDLLPQFDAEGHHLHPVTPWGEPWLHGHVCATKLIQDGLARLPIENRIMYVLRDALGLSIQDASALTGHEPDRARVLLHHARFALRAFLSPHMELSAESYFG